MIRVKFSEVVSSKQLTENQEKLHFRCEEPDAKQGWKTRCGVEDDVWSLVYDAEARKKVVTWQVSALIS